MSRIQKAPIITFLFKKIKNLITTTANAQMCFFKEVIKQFMEDVNFSQLKFALKANKKTDDLLNDPNVSSGTTNNHPI